MSSFFSSNPSYVAQFQSLDRLLDQQQLFWRSNPFPEGRIDWQSQNPQLSRALLELDDQLLAQLAADSNQLAQWLSQWLPWAPELLAICQLPLAEKQPLQLSPFLATGIPGRKWQQISQFTAALNNPKQQVTADASAIVDWCCGKGHLSRAIASHFKQPVNGLEYNQQLCEKGNCLSKKHQLPVKIHQQDVLQDSVVKYLKRDNLPVVSSVPVGSTPSPSHPSHIVALHACGDLHTQLIQQSVACEINKITFSPCCYHLIKSDNYQPLSKLAKKSSLLLSRDDLKLAVLETVTAPTRVDRQRRQLNQWRLAFDALQRQQRGIDQYLPVPSLSPKLLANGFTSFCQHLSQLKQLPLDDKIDYQHWLEVGQNKFGQIERLELVRRLFRRPLELWLVLDRCLYLEQNGYHVSLSIFCYKALTPRNILISAAR
ncbi:methyltransferase [Pelagibaculum spongiae]|uniref:SAM-dependent methyltransferase n=1 Tax=Pelagibaculum spongiae TaxID=2080658 RepID=A0A2V1H029_9GAMM|nr:methyltransferase [Pelagibaculum spongiae]PVZ72039.1 SAM-dependent methyltransferase [Pelagibaculum spongiae]